MRQLHFLPWLLTTGTRDQDVLTLAHRLLHRLGGVAGFAQCHLAHLIKIHGLGPVTAARLLAALTLPGRAHATTGIAVRCPDDLAPVLRPMFSMLRHERFAVAICDRQARVRAVRAIATQPPAPRTARPPHESVTPPRWPG